MKKFLVLGADAAIFSAAAIFAWLVRIGLEDAGRQYTDFLPYAVSSLPAGAVIFYLFRLHKHFFRFFSMPEFIRTASAVTMAVLVTMLVAFTHFRLEGVPRSLPFLHGVFALGGIVALRLTGRWLGIRKEKFAQAGAAGKRREAVLIVGFTPLAELYLRAVRLHGGHNVHPIGILDDNTAMQGHTMQQCEVIGQPRDLPEILLQLSIHGLRIRTVVLAVSLEDLDEEARKVLTELEGQGRIHVRDFQRHLADFMLPIFGEETDVEKKPVKDRVPLPAGVREKVQAACARYDMAKRVLDVTVAVVIGGLALPVLGLILPLVRLTMGSPVIFWQERPGRNGRIFRLYKLRTLKPGVGADGQILKDEDRLTAMGAFLRRTRLDELPQLFNVVRGDMSFIGPRPLLPIDLPKDMPQWNALRAKAQPGLTGWAQINGGKAVSKEDKVVLDVWYLCNMSWGLDLRILWMTLKVMAAGEKLDRDAIRRAHEDLGLEWAGDFTRNDAQGKYWEKNERQTAEKTQ